MARYAGNARSGETEALELSLDDRHSQLSQFETGSRGGVNIIQELRGLQLVPKRLHIENQNLIIVPEPSAETSIEAVTDGIEQTQNLITQITLQL